MNSRRALLLDKDGVVNVDHGYVCTPARTKFIDGIFELCRTATHHGYINVLITNQAGIARGYYTEREFLTYVDWLRDQFQQRGASLDAVYYCPHHPTFGRGRYLCDCECRKPKPGMIFDAARDLNLDLRNSVLLGDSISDIQAGLAAGVGTCVQLPATQFPESVTTALDSATVARVAGALVDTNAPE